MLRIVIGLMEVARGTTVHTGQKQAAAREEPKYLPKITM
jgi:ABC-type transport system involved in cytochrome c biogenesis ATPase subunit